MDGLAILVNLDVDGNLCKRGEQEVQAVCIIISTVVLSVLHTSVSYALKGHKCLQS